MSPYAPGTHVEYSIDYTEKSALGGTVKVVYPVVHKDHPDRAVNAHLAALRTRRYQERVGLPVDAVAVVRTVTVAEWAPVHPEEPSDEQVAEWVGQVADPYARELIVNGYTGQEPTR